MKSLFVKKVLSVLLVLCIMMGMSAGITPVSAEPVTESAISADQFKTPDMEYRPGVRWWWTTGSTTEDLVGQIDYLSDNMFGAVEINPFNSAFIIDGAGGATSQASSAQTVFPDPALTDYDTPTYYAKLAAVIAAAESKGIIVDLNMGSGYCAASKDVTAQDSMENMALGRTTLTVSGSQIDKELTLTVPDVEISPLYVTTATGIPMAEWTGVRDIQAIIISKIAGEGTNLTAGNQFIDYENKTIAKTYNKQSILDVNKTTVIDVANTGVKAGDTIKWTPGEEGDWEVTVLYSVPSASSPIRGIYSPDNKQFVTDHMDGQAVKRYVDGWLGSDLLNPIIEQYQNTIRAAFNDSYEFYTDRFYNYKVYDLAKNADKNPAGYDLSRYIPMLYKLSENCFTIGKTNSNFVQYNKSTDAFLTYNISADEKTRITYDYNQVIDQLFQEGMQSFTDTLGNYDVLYRQQAYNPPIDTLKSSKYVDIPETEGLSEYSLKRVSSGAHLYGKNLVTSEVYTLGSVPYKCTPSFIKNGYDLMATSGVNNFFYHGLSSIYYGSEEAKAVNAYGESGWRGWSAIGIEVGQADPLSAYMKSLNSYAARLNYLMQQGTQSSDVAVYMPLFGSVSETNAVRAMNQYGYTWDAMNDDCIQNEISYVDGKIVVASSGMTYDALLIQTQTVPVATMNALKALAAQGAPIVFYGDLPNKQPSFADGDYINLDAQVGTKAAALLNDYSNVVQVNSIDAYAQILESVVNTPVSYEYNTSVRFNRRTLSTGGEVVYIRNTSATAPSTVTLTVDEALQNCYWLDQNDGNIYNAVKNADGTITLTLQAGNAMGLLCEPEGVKVAENDVCTGIPESITVETASESVTLNDLTLTVTADNIGTNKKGEVQTVTYTGNVLGNWNNDTFQGGALKYVSDIGVYETAFNVPDVSVYDAKKSSNAKRLVLNIGEANTSATIFVNDQNLGQVMFKPYALDITSALKKGNNKIRIELQPLGFNRRAGFSKYFTDNKAALGDEYWFYNFYREYVGNVTNATLNKEGLEGPVTLNTYNATETFNTTITLANPEIISYVADEAFDVIVTAPGDTSKVKIVNENGAAIGKKAEVITKNTDGTKSYRITLAVGTPGERTLSAMVMGQIGDYKDVGAALEVKIVPPAPVPAEDIISASSVSSAGVNTPFTVTVVTSASVNKVKIVGETGSSIGTLSSSVVTNGNTKTWTLSIKVGSKGNRTLTALGAAASGGYGTAGKAFNISIQ